MNKVVRVKNDNFTIISNVFLKDKNLSIKAKGFLSIVMGLPSDWEFSINGICSTLKEGKTAIYNVIDELKDNGYCKVITSRDNKGRIIGNDYTFYEEPQMQSPHTDYPYMENLNMDNQDMDNQPQLNTNNINNINNKELKEEKEKINKKEVNESINYNDVKEKWEELNPNLPSIRCFNEKRKKALKVLLKNNNANIEELYKVFEIISVCSFCQGKNDRNWTATLDWLINDTKSCFNRLLEGVYAFNEEEKQKVLQIVNGEQYQYDTADNKKELVINGEVYK